MSANRSVQAAQRRRAGPPEPQQTQRGPNTSINSAAAFSKQPQNIPSGKLAGQHASLAQQNYMAEQKAEMRQQPNPKISVAKAITLLSLRMGRVETMINNILSGEHQGNINSSSNGDSSFQLENAILEDIVHRLEDLERQPQQYSGASSNMSVDTAAIKQQLDAHTKTIKQTELATISVVKNYQTIKTALDNVKNDLLDTKNVLNSIQKITEDHDGKIKQMETSISTSFGILANSDNNNAEDFDLNNLEFNEEEELLNADINMAAIVEDDEEVEEEN